MPGPGDRQSPSPGSGGELCIEPQAGSLSHRTGPFPLLSLLPWGVLSAPGLLPCSCHTDQQQPCYCLAAMLGHDPLEGGGWCVSLTFANLSASVTRPSTQWAFSEHFLGQPWCSHQLLRGHPSDGIKDLGQRACLLHLEGKGRVKI